MYSVSSAAILSAASIAAAVGISSSLISIVSRRLKLAPVLPPGPIGGGSGKRRGKSPPPEPVLLLVVTFFSSRNSRIRLARIGGRKYVKFSFYFKETALTRLQYMLTALTNQGYLLKKPQLFL